ncbi:hypothetical protein ACFY6U_49305 [Streptomyces sp. NPDC013157]|uniref:RraA family protein n=1 Tax=Streptomyces sp. NPDC013157 TaxID=3364861 RepID=UPI0036C17FD2
MSTRRCSRPARQGARHWEADTTITCGGVTVQPGDIVVGDDDGVVVIPEYLVVDRGGESGRGAVPSSWSLEAGVRQVARESLTTPGSRRR